MILSTWIEWVLSKKYMTKHQLRKCKFTYCKQMNKKNKILVMKNSTDFSLELLCNQILILRKANLHIILLIRKQILLKIELLLDRRNTLKKQLNLKDLRDTKWMITVIQMLDTMVDLPSPILSLVQNFVLQQKNSWNQLVNKFSLENLTWQQWVSQSNVCVTDRCWS